MSPAGGKAESADRAPEGAIGASTITVDGGEPLSDSDYETVSATIDVAGGE